MNLSPSRNTRLFYKLVAQLWYALTAAPAWDDGYSKGYNAGYVQSYRDRGFTQNEKVRRIEEQWKHELQ